MLVGGVHEVHLGFRTLGLRVHKDCFGLTGLLGFLGSTISDDPSNGRALYRGDFGMIRVWKPILLPSRADQKTLGFNSPRA